MEEKKVIFKNKRLCYKTAGTGEMVLLVHGFGEDGNIWDNQYIALNNYHLIIPDLPGTGESELTDDVSMGSLAEALRFIIETESKGADKKVIMIGHSMGGYVTLAFAEKYMNFLKGFGLFHSTAYADTETKIATRRKGISFIEQYGAFEFLKTSIPNLYSPLTRENNSSLIEQQINASHNFSPSTLVSYYKAMIERKEKTEVLKKAGLPVLFVAGRDDNAVPLKDALEQCILPDFSYIHILDRSGHMGMREEPEKMNHILSAYLDSLLT